MIHLGLNNWTIIQHLFWIYRTFNRTPLLTPTTAKTVTISSVRENPPNASRKKCQRGGNSFSISLSATWTHFSSFSVWFEPKLSVSSSPNTLTLFISSSLIFSQSYIRAPGIRGATTYLYNKQLLPCYCKLCTYCSNTQISYLAFSLSLKGHDVRLYLISQNWIKRHSIIPFMPLNSLSIIYIEIYIQP